MKETPREKQLVSCPLDELVDAILGDADEKPITENLALAIHSICKNHHTAFIQFPGDGHVNILDRPIVRPILWRHHRYASSTERWLKAKKIAEQERKDSYVFRHNLEIAVRAVMKETGLDREQCLPLAIKQVKRGKAGEKTILAFGGKPFIKSFEELQ